LSNRNGMLSRGVQRISSQFAPRVVSARLAHTDKQFPDLGYYRTKPAPADAANFIDVQLEEKEARRAKFYTLNAALASSAVWMAANVVCQAVNVLNPSQDILALATVELELDQMGVGESGVFVWRGKPIFVKHRTPEDIRREGAVNVAELRHAQVDAERVVDPNWLVVIGICTHLGCVPIDNAGEFFGYYCPCHGSHYDASGRIRKGPAPLNLEVPPYKFTNATTVLIG